MKIIHDCISSSKILQRVQPSSVFYIARRKIFLDEEILKGQLVILLIDKVLIIWKKRLIVPGGWHNITSSRSKLY